MKSGNQVWGTLRPRENNRTTKADLLAFLAQEGFSLQKGPTENAREWNELARYFAVNGNERHMVAVVMTSERPNWADMLRSFELALRARGAA